MFLNGMGAAQGNTAQGELPEHAQYDGSSLSDVQVGLAPDAAPSSPESPTHWAEQPGDHVPIFSSHGSASSGTDQDPDGGGGGGGSPDNLSPIAEGVPTSTSDRHQEFLMRKAERKMSRAKKKGAPSTLDTHGFLSHLPEVHADIAYRFCFTVIGVAAETAVKEACGAEVQTNNALPPPSPAKHGRGVEAYRCFSHVPYPFGSEREFTTPGRLDPKKFSSDVPKLCKLIFDHRQGAWDIPGCRTRMEALSSALISILVVDPADGEPSFHEQLLQYERVVDQIHFARKPLRPARAIILCRHEGQPDDPVATPPGHLHWTSRLEEYEMCLDDNLWKLGPVNLTNGMDVHSVFATIASKRIMRGHESQGEESDGSQQSDPPPCYDAEMDEEHMPNTSEDEEPIWMTHLHEVTDSEDERESATLMMHQGDMSPLGPSRYTGGRQQWLSAMQRGAA